MHRAVKLINYSESFKRNVEDPSSPWILKIIVSIRAWRVMDRAGLTYNLYFKIMWMVNCRNCADFVYFQSLKCSYSVFFSKLQIYSNLFTKRLSQWVAHVKYMSLSNNSLSSKIFEKLYLAVTFRSHLQNRFQFFGFYFLCVYIYVEISEEKSK